MLASGLLSATKRVFHHHDEISTSASLHVLRDVDGEGRACATVAEHLLSVEVERCVVIDGTEVEQDVLASPTSRNVKGALVPEAGDEVGVLHAREAALRAEGNGNLAVEALAFAPTFLGSRLAEVEAVRPSTVQVDPIGTFELRTRVFAARRIRSLHTAAQPEQQGRCHEQLAEMFHHNVLYYII